MDITVPVRTGRFQILNCGKRQFFELLPIWKSIFSSNLHTSKFKEMKRFRTIFPSQRLMWLSDHAQYCNTVNNNMFCVFFFFFYHRISDPRKKEPEVITSASWSLRTVVGWSLDWHKVVNVLTKGQCQVSLRTAWVFPLLTRTDYIHPWHRFI